MNILEQWGVSGLGGADYEFRFHSNGMVLAVHIVRLASDSEACARAQSYLEATRQGH